jgi:hypothetical protein
MQVNSESVKRKALTDRLRAFSTSLVKSSAKPDIVNESNPGKISFHDDGGAEILMPLMQPGSCGSTELEDITFCIPLLGKLNTGFGFSLTTSQTGPKCQFWIQKEQLQKLPLLLDFVNMPSNDALPGATTQQDALKGLPTKRQRRSTGMFTQANVDSVSFNPPASASGLACLLLLLEDVGSPLQLFGASICGPRLAVQCLKVRSTSCCARALSSASYPGHLARLTCQVHFWGVG